MDFLKNLSGKSDSSSSSSDPSKQQSAIDFVQEHVLKQGSQKNESAAEQAKDSQIASGVKSLYKMATGKDFPGSK
ncbi:hypothetical protein NLJ89_g2741 [Agrocybe chaxingu]|uniref:Uncharacterized protein n=1 Tax=Agrocybe chaxingu TaxID=84603 RepID=A0A9W8KBZ1_9AGAR|nr:hypothetical protein NLJ89_g2741 [Agrocybe chaxingu]